MVVKCPLRSVLWGEPPCGFCGRETLTANIYVFMVTEWGVEVYLYSEDVECKCIRNVHIYTKLHGVTSLKSSSEINRIATQRGSKKKIIGL